jgi:hypothetical protein
VNLLEKRAGPLGYQLFAGYFGLNDAAARSGHNGNDVASR